MDIRPYFHRLCELHSVSMATVDKQGHPQNRIADLFFCDGDKLYFYTARGKDFYEDLTHKNEVAVRLANAEIDTIDSMVEDGIYIDRSDAIRSMIREKIVSTQLTTELAQSKFTAASSLTR